MLSCAPLRARGPVRLGFSNRERTAVCSGVVEGGIKGWNGGRRIKEASRAMPVRRGFSM